MAGVYGTSLKLVDSCELLLLEHIALWWDGRERVKRETCEKQGRNGKAY